jgi:hypothetical protein
MRTSAPAIGTAGNEATNAADRVKLPPGYKAVIGGDAEIMVSRSGIWRSRCCSRSSSST